MTNDNERSIREIANAEVVPNAGGPNEWLLRFGDNEYDLVPQTERNRLLVETDLLADAEDGVFLGVDREGHDDNAVMFEADFDNGSYTIATNGDSLTVPSRYLDDAFAALREEDGDAMLDLYQQVRAEHVHEDVVNRFLSRFNSDIRGSASVEVTDEGWLIEGTFIVQWNAENYIVDDMEVHVRDGNSTAVVDDSKQARDFNFSLPESVETTPPDGSGEEVTLGQREQRFLATVELLINPHEHLDEDRADTIDDMKEWSKDPISAAANTATVSAFTDEKTGLHHGHGLNKHRLSDLGVTDEAIDHLYYNDYDHAGVVELAYREEHFHNANFDVFEDAGNRDVNKWEKIHSTRESAPVPERVHRELRQMYGEPGESAV